jgi:SNF2 family DNA or RNA helicase
MILSGTPIVQGIEDLYAQFRFLNWEIIGIPSYYAFRNKYCIMGGFKHREIVGYDNVDELLKLIEPYTVQVNAADVIDCPKEIIESRIVNPTKQQHKMLKDLGDPYEMSTKQGDIELMCETVLERMIRYQQITSGIFPYKIEEFKDPTTGKIKKKYSYEYVEGKNPKIDATMDVIDEIRPESKAIIWARFKPERDEIRKRLKERFGANSYVTYAGETPKDQRKATIKRFQNDPDTRFIVCSQQSAARGQEFSVADTHIYVSRTFSYDDWKQSKARTNSSKQKSKSVLLVIILMKHEVEQSLSDALANKQSLAQFVNETISKLIKKGQR